MSSQIWFRKLETMQHSERERVQLTSRELRKPQRQRERR